MEKLIIVSNRLPVTVTVNDDGMSLSPSTGGLATGLNSSFKNSEYLWIGWPGFYPEKKSVKMEINERLQERRLAPVYLTKSQVNLFYEGFSNSTLWPLFHYFPSYTGFSEEQWEVYKNVNQLFCEEILKHADEDTLIWIHDYHLMLLPELVRQKLPRARIGYFQHIPFPSHEIFRILPCRQDVLKGLMGADLIGFHTYDDVKNFLTSAHRVLGTDNKIGELRYEDRIVYADAFPMGINYEAFENAAKSEDTEKSKDEYCRQCGPVKVILSIDRLDYSKGIPERLKGFELFLEKNPEYREKVTLLMIIAPSREKVSMYKKLKVEIDELVGQINAKYRTINWSPVLYFYRSFPFESLPSLYKLADIALVTPLRDGMNLVCKEYIATRTDQTGVLILSEMAGAAKELHEALIINPFNIHEIAEAIKTSLLIPVEEQQRRMSDMQHRLRQYNVTNWVKLFIHKLEEVHEKQKEMSMKQITEDVFRKIASEFSVARQRKLFLDYDGTLVPITEKPEYARPDQELLDVLLKVAEEDNTRLVIISGRDKNTLNEWFGAYSTIDLVAEHGVWVKKDGGEWVLNAYVTNDWKARIRPFLELFVNRTPGSFIEEKSYSLAWHYRQSDPDLGEIRSRELIELMQYFSSNLNINVQEGKKVVEIKSSEINKGIATLDFLEKEDDFILAAGDDWTDEDMFKVMPPSAYTIKVGHSPSLAKYNLLPGKTDPSGQIRRFLKELVAVGVKEEELK